MDSTAAASAVIARREDVTEITFTSPRSGNRYTIAVDDRGQVKRCLCAAGRRGVRCYHAREAELAALCLRTGLLRHQAIALLGIKVSS